MLARILYNPLQAAVVIGFGPLVEGVAARLKEIVKLKRGPSILQPYRDLWKLLHEDETPHLTSPSPRCQADSSSFPA